MAQMEGEQEHGQDVKGRDQRMRKADDHHRIHIVVIERVERERVKAGIGSADREMQDVIDDEGEQNDPAPDHAP